MEGYLTARELAARAGFHVDYIRKLAVRGEIAGAEKACREWVFPVAAAEKWLAMPRPQRGTGIRKDA